MESTNELLAMDEKGRVRVSVERREMLLREFAGCGLSAAAFARRAGVKYQTFMYWLNRSRQSRGEPRAGQVSTAWVEATVEAGSPDRGEGLRIEFPGGAWTVIEEERQASMAAALLKALGAKDGMEIVC
jgi:hypothetical protein